MPEWEQVGGFAPLWKPTKKGETLEGEVIRKTMGTYGPSIDIKTEKGIFATPAHKALQGQLDILNVNDYVRITFQGMGRAKKSNREFQSYKLERRKD